MKSKHGNNKHASKSSTSVADATGPNRGDANEFEALEHELRQQRPEMDDAFFDGLHQRIMNEVAVTPAPQASSGATSGQRPRIGIWSGLKRWLAQPAFVTAGVIAAVALLIALLPGPGLDPNSDPVDNGSGSGEIVWHPREDAGPVDRVAIIEIPESALDSGFLEYRELTYFDDLDLEALALDIETVADFDALGIEAEMADLAFASDPYEDLTGSWRLDDLSTDELDALSALLEG